MIGMILLFVGLFMLVRVLGQVGEKSAATCKLHKWEYNSNGFLECTVCNKTPEDILRSLF